MLKARTATNVYKLSVYLLITFMSRSDNKRRVLGRSTTEVVVEDRWTRLDGKKIEYAMRTLLVERCGSIRDNLQIFIFYYFFRGLLTFNPISVSDATEQIFSFIPTRFNPLLVSGWLEWVLK